MNPNLANRRVRPQFPCSLATTLLAFNIPVPYCQSSLWLSTFEFMASLLSAFEVGSGCSHFLPKNTNEVHRRAVRVFLNA